MRRSLCGLCWWELCSVRGGPPTKEERRLYSAGKQGRPELSGFSEKQKSGEGSNQPTGRRDTKARDRQHSSVTVDQTGVDNLVTQGDCEIKSFLQKDLRLPRLSEYHHSNCQICTWAKTDISMAASESDKGKRL